MEGADAAGLAQVPNDSTHRIYHFPRWTVLGSLWFIRRNHTLC